MFPKILDAINRFTNVRIFLITISITFLNPKIFGFLLLRETAWGAREQGSEMWEINHQKIVRNLLDKFRKLRMNGTV